MRRHCAAALSGAQRRRTSTSRAPAAALSAPRASTSAEAIALESRYCARTYAPLPFVVARAKGCMTWSPEGVPRLDFLAAFSAVNQGHCHPRLLAALTEQASRLTLVSRAFHGDGLGAFARDLTAAFGQRREGRQLGGKPRGLPIRRMA